MKNVLQILLIILGINFILALGASYFFDDVSLYAKSLIKIGLTTTMLFVVIFVMIQTKETYRLFANSFWAVPLMLILIALAFNNLEETIAKRGNLLTAGHHITYLFSCLLVGIFEELFFRVYLFKKVFNTISKSQSNRKTIYLRSILITSLLFGLAHLFNFYKSEATVVAVISQVVFAFIIGIFFQALYIRVQNLVLIAGLHGLVNYFGMYKTKLLGISSQEQAISLLDIVTSFGILLAFFLLIVAPISYVLIRSKLTREPS